MFRSLISFLLLLATMVCCAHAFAQDFDGDGLSDNETISSLAHKHMPAALGQRQSQRSLWQRWQAAGGGGNKGRACRSVIAWSLAKGDLHSPLNLAVTAFSYSYAGSAADNKRWLALGVLRI